jgi:hypothetical protein
VEPLEACAEHRTVVFVAESTGDVDHAIGVDAHEIPVVREMVNGQRARPLTTAATPWSARSSRIWAA